MAKYQAKDFKYVGQKPGQKRDSCFDNHVFYAVLDDLDRGFTPEAILARVFPNETQPYSLALDLIYRIARREIEDSSMDRHTFHTIKGSYNVAHPEFEDMMTDDELSWIFDEFDHCKTPAEILYAIFDDKEAHGKLATFGEVTVMDVLNDLMYIRAAMAELPNDELSKYRYHTLCELVDTNDLDVTFCHLEDLGWSMHRICNFISLMCGCDFYRIRRIYDTYRSRNSNVPFTSRLSDEF